MCSPCSRCELDGVLIPKLVLVHVQVFQPIFRADATLDLIERHAITAFIAVPAMVAALIEAAQAQQARLTTAANSASSPPSNQTPGTHRLDVGPPPESRSKGSSACRGIDDTERRKGGVGMEGFASVQRILLGGGELPQRLQQRLRLLFPAADVLTAYGMTEACSSMTFQSLLPETALGQRSSDAVSGSTPAERHTGHIFAAGVCVGRPPPGIEMAVLLSHSASDTPQMVTDTSLEMQISAEPDRAGEVLTRGPHVMLGYWGDPPATVAVTVSGGWLRTGDLGCFDASGNLWLLGRLKVKLLLLRGLHA